MKSNIPCMDCGMERMIDTSKFSVERYVARSPRCRKCATRQPELQARISKGWFTTERSKGNRLREGSTPWNKGVYGYMGANRTSFKREDMLGPKNINWKGGVTPLNTKLRNTPEYRDWRTTVFRRDDYTCQKCGGRGYKLHADHIKPWAYFPELRLVTDNGRTLCVDCHKRTPTYGTKAKKIYG